MNISETSRPITTKFYLKHHWGGGKAALGFDADQIRTLVSMATDSSHRVIMGKRALSRFFGQIPPLTTELAALERLKNRCHHVISVDIDPIFFKLAGNKNMHNIMNEFEFRPERTTDYGVSCP